MTLSIIVLDAECCYADCHLGCMAFMLSVESKLYMLSVVMLNVIMLNVVMLNVVVPQKYGPQRFIVQAPAVIVRKF